MALAIEGRGETYNTSDDTFGDDTAYDETVRKYWNAFTAAQRREYNAIPYDIAASITQVYCIYSSYYRFRTNFAQYIKGPLVDEIDLARSKRPRRFANKKVLFNFARQLWMADWFKYNLPGGRIDDWALLLGNTFSSSRIGEYIESTCRAGTGRGLHYRVQKPNQAYFLGL